MSPQECLAVLPDLMGHRSPMSLLLGLLGLLTAMYGASLIGRASARLAIRKLTRRPLPPKRSLLLGRLWAWASLRWSRRVSRGGNAVSS